MKFKLLASIGLLVAAMATPSLAADLPRPAYKAPGYLPAAVFSWSGFYIGANVGYGFGDSTWSAAGFNTGDFDVKGWTAGGTIGYNIQTGSIVWGIEGDIDWSNVKGSSTAAPCAVGAPCETKNLWLGTARGRIGYAFDRFLPYITGGAAFGGVKMTPDTTTPTISETDTRFGWTLGAGIEYAFMGAWSAKLEYLYVDLGKANCSAATCGVPADVTFKTSNVRFGINYRF